MAKQQFIEDNLIILSKQTLDKFMKTEHAADLISLYVFYYYTAKWQKTNCVKATRDYVLKGLKWGKSRYTSINKMLIELGLIEPFIRKDSTGKVKGHYIKICYIWKNENLVFEEINHKPQIETVENQPKKPQALLSTGGQRPTNALNANNINALNANKNTPDAIFDSARKLYPETKRGNATEFENFQKHSDWKKALPLLRPAIERQIRHKAHLKETNQFCPGWKHFQTWINQRCWEEELPGSDEPATTETDPDEADILFKDMNAKGYK